MNITALKVAFENQAVIHVKNWLLYAAITGSPNYFVKYDD